jgi:hypothetical protein
MERTKVEQIKLYVVIGLALLAGVLAYFRFLHQKPAKAACSQPSAFPVSQLLVPEVEAPILKSTVKKEPPPVEAPPVVLRDIFEPIRIGQETPRKNQEDIPQPAEPNPPRETFKLKGTLLGRGEPLAIIDHQIVRAGSQLGKYKVSRIRKNEVVLDWGHQKIVLEMVKYD